MKKLQFRVTALSTAFVLAFSVHAAAVLAGDDADIDHGRYLVKLGGCNDCHTSGYLLSAGEVAEDKWLLGDAFGWRGPWGTTYASNLRIRLSEFSEDEWVAFARQLKTRPPMPWFTLNQLAESDLRAIYRYVQHLGPAGGPAPAYLPPGEEPATPYALFP